MLRAKKSGESILLLNAEDFTSSYTSQLLSYLEDVPGFKVNNTLNFTTRTQIRSQERVPVLEAFNQYLMMLSRDVDRIIITL